MPTVSFVITIYNKAKFIPFVVRSLFAQQGIGECEYIFVNDGSTDDSLTVLEDCTRAHDNVKIITQRNAGPAIATNRAIAAVSGSYIKFVDGDDVLHPRSSFELLRAIKATNVELAYSLGEVVPFNSEKFKAPGGVVSDASAELIPDPLALIARKAIFNLTCVLASTDVVRRMGGCDERVFIQDYSFALRAAHQTKFALVPKILNFPAEDVNQRASAIGGGAQVLHDLNAVLGYFVADHPDLDSNMKAYMMKRAAGRAWNWARRHEKKSMLSAEFLAHIRARMMPMFGNTADNIHKTCAIFRSSTPIRVPVP